MLDWKPQEAQNLHKMDCSAARSTLTSDFASDGENRRTHTHMYTVFMSCAMCMLQYVYMRISMLEGRECCEMHREQENGNVQDSLFFIIFHVQISSNFIIIFLAYFSFQTSFFLHFLFIFNFIADSHSEPEHLQKLEDFFNLFNHFIFILLARGT